MLGRKTFRVAGAAIVGSLALLATSTAHAIVDLDAADKSEPAVTFAKELLKASTTHGEVAYYTVTATGSPGDGDAGLVRAKLGTSVARGKTATVVFSFQNLVFIHATNTPALTVTKSDGSAIAAVPAHSAGGASGDSSVTFTLSPTEALPADAVLELGIPTEGVGISADNPVSVTMDVEADPFLVGGTPTTHQASYANAIDAQLSINVTSAPRTVRASVDEGYLRFTGSNTFHSGRRARFGDLSWSVEPHLEPDGTVAEATALFTVGGADARLPGSAAPADSSVVITGDFSFIDKAMFDDASDCEHIDLENLAINRNVIADDDKTQLVAQNLKRVTDNTFCVRVSEAADAAPILAGNYVAEVTFDYVDAVNTDFAPATYTVALGSIIRDGTEVHIPYLTTDERYNQRIVIANRGAATTYRMRFTSEAGITATAGTAASGDLPSGTTVLRTRDVVTVEGGPPHRASGTIMIEATTGTVSVATNQTNRRDGGTDTVVYTLVAP